MAWTIGDHLGYNDESNSSEQSSVECPGCGAKDSSGDDFCHECGHSFEHVSTLAHANDYEDQVGPPCPVCHSGELATLDHGRTQCDICGYMVRDEGW